MRASLVVLPCTENPKGVGRKKEWLEHCKSLPAQLANHVRAKLLPRSNKSRPALMRFILSAAALLAVKSKTGCERSGNWFLKRGAGPAGLARQSPSPKQPDREPIRVAQPRSLSIGDSVLHNPLQEKSAMSVIVSGALTAPSSSVV